MRDTVYAWLTELTVREAFAIGRDPTEFRKWADKQKAWSASDTNMVIRVCQWVAESYNQAVSITAVDLD